MFSDKLFSDGLRFSLARKMTRRQLCLLSGETMSPRVKAVQRSRRWKATDQQGVTPEELQKMVEVSKDDRHALRNECMLLVGFRFGLRVSELLSLRVGSIDL